MEEISKHIQEKISAISDRNKAKWLENYVKHNIKSKGVGIPEIRQIVKEANQKYRITQTPLNKQIILLNHLMAQEYTEHKLSAILFIQLFWKDISPDIKIEVISNWFEDELISDWNVCDWLCVRIMTPLVENDLDKIIDDLTSWNKSKNLWKARASLVSFAQIKSIEKYLKIIHSFAERLIKREERFCKTAVGWILREISKRNKKYVTEFILKYNKWMTKEVINNSTKYFSK